MKKNNSIKKLIYRFPYIGRLIKDRDSLLVERDSLAIQLSSLRNLTKNEIASMFYAGHYYSPIPSKINVKEKINNKLNSVSLNFFNQKLVLRSIAKYYKDLPWEEKKKKLFYYYKNTNFTFGDAINYFGLIRDLKPKKIIEVGSGYSSCVALDTNYLFFKNKINITLIEPYPELIISLISDVNRTPFRLIKSPLQKVDKKIFKSLSSNDILFIDSSHVSKKGSELHSILFSILPSLKKGVIVHFHDILFPFEYPKKWFEMGLFWNEAYLIHAFLMYNDSFEIIIFNDYIRQKENDYLKKMMPLALKNTGGSIYLRKIK